MPIFEAIRLALSQLRVQKLKSFFTLLGVTISVMFLIAVVSIVEGMGKYVEQDFAAKFLGVNVFNDVFDTQSGADEANVNPTQFSGGSRVILYGLVTMRRMALLAAAFYAVGIGIGILLAALRGWDLLWLGLAGENLPDDHDISAAFERLLAVQAELFRLPQMQRVSSE